MRLWSKLRAYASLRARRNRTDAMKYLVRRPLILGAIGAYEGAVLLSSRLDTRVKAVALVRSSSLIGCPF